MIELLVVVAIIGILAAVLAPVSMRLLGQGDEVTARNNLRVLGQAALAYLSDHGGYPSAGGYFSSFTLINSNGQTEEVYGRSRGWVYFEHDCPRSAGDSSAEDSIGDGQGNNYGIGYLTSSSSTSYSGDYVNEAGVCTCFNSTTEEGGLGATPASWYGADSGDDQWTQGETAIVNGGLYEYVNKNLEVFTNPAFEKAAEEQLKVKRSQIFRAYAMNVITGADEDLYGTDRPRYSNFNTTDKVETDRGHSSTYNTIKVGPRTLKAYESASEDADKFLEVLSMSETALFVELDLSEKSTAQANSLAGDQVWDWDGGDECMGFNHEDHGSWIALVCFADGRVGTVRDPSADPESPDTAKRLKVSKYYGSGGVNASGEKMD